MSWIQTYGGRQFWPLAPDARDLDIADIAHSLSLLCRFNGHCRAFYSVAEHSVRVSDILPPHLALWGLLHDAAEAYLGDLTRPLKQDAAWFNQAEARLLEVVADAFGLAWPMPAAVLQADDVLLATEARDLMAAPPAPWRLDVDPLPEPIRPLSPGEAEALFLKRFGELTKARAEACAGAEPMDDHWRWRLEMAEAIAGELDPEAFGVQAFYLFGSVKNATAGPGSDIDILIHFRGTPDQREALDRWLEERSRALAEMNRAMTGYRSDGLLDIHLVTDEDIRNRSSYAVKIGATSDGARELPLQGKARVRSDRA